MKEYSVIPVTSKPGKNERIMTESRFVVTRAVGRRDPLQRDIRELSKLIEMFYTLMVLVVTQVYTFVKTVHLKCILLHGNNTLI